MPADLQVGHLCRQCPQCYRTCS